MPVHVITSVYDAAGRRLSVEDDRSTIRHAYDELGRIKQVTRCLLSKGTGEICGTFPPEPGFGPCGL